jgi:hypothetical protein
MAELFINYDTEREPYWLRLVRYLTLTSTLHIILIVSAIYIPALRNMFLIAFLFGNANYVDEQYVKANIQDYSITWVDGKFQYPVGYFSKEAPWNQVVKEQVIEKPKLASVKEIKKKKPKPTPKPTPEGLASNLPTPSPTPETQELAEAEKENDEKPSEQEIEDEMHKQAEEANIKRPPKINTRPFKDLIAEATKMWESGELDLSGSIEMFIEADLAQDGTLKNIRVNKKKGDPKLEEMAKKFVQALSASRGLAFLDGVSHLSLSIKLNENSFNATANTQVPTAERASEMAEGYSSLLWTERMFRSDPDKALVLKNTKISSDGNNIVVKFSMPRTTAKALLSKHVPKG